VRAQPSIAHYHLTAKLGQGAMGEVWRATDTKLDREVAIKVLPESFADDPERMARFKREAKVLASLNHPNIAQIYGIEDGALVMELVEGETLHGPLPVETALAYARQIADALEAAHEKGIIHRDLKPGNVMVTADGMIKVLDFGLARMTEKNWTDDPSISPTLPGSLSGVGVILGTAAYMAPEQARGKAVDKRADIWAFGCVLYELLTGERPFRGDDIGETLAAVIKQEPDLGCVPASVRKLVTSCLEKDPKRRLRDIGDAWRLLSTAELVPTPRPRAKLLWILAAVALIAAAAGGWLLHRAAPADARVLRLDIEPPPGGKFAMDSMAMGLAVSPDGGTLAYVASGVDGINRLYLSALGEHSVRPLPGTEDARYPFWSPDGNTVGFFNEKKLMRIDRNGSGLQTVADTTSGRGGAWLPDGRIVFGSIGEGLRIAPATGGNFAPFTERPMGEISHLWPQALPHGQIMYFVRRFNGQESSAYVTSLKNPLARTLLMNVPQSPVYVPGASDTDCLLWQRGTALVAQAINRDTLKLAGPVSILVDPVTSGGIDGQIYATASKQGPLIYNGIPRLSQFTWFDRAGRNLGTVGTPDSYDFGSFRISPDGQYIATARNSTASSEMGLLEIARGVFNGLPNSNINSFPAWAPDSTALAYAHLIFHFATASSSDGTGTPWDWSPDGRQLLFRRLVDGVRDEILAQPLTPSHTLAGDPRVFAGGLSARFSPNGHWVAFSSIESGEHEIYVAAFPSALPKVRISTAGGDFPVWSPDGREIYYVQPGNKLMAVALKTTDDFIQPASPQQLFVLRVSETPRYPFDVAKDGRFLVRADVPQASHSLTAIVNWQSLVK
jgi:Tol biopolymer transport system component/predicted Ser/Thr protein kinase